MHAADALSRWLSCTLGGRAAEAQRSVAPSVMKMNLIRFRFLWCCGVAITLLNKVTKQSTKVETDESGEYSACLSPGSYDVVASALGFKSGKRKSIKVERSGKSIIDFPIKRGKPVTSH